MLDSISMSDIKSRGLKVVAPDQDGSFSTSAAAGFAGNQFPNGVSPRNNELPYQKGYGGILFSVKEEYARLCSSVITPPLNSIR